MYIVLATDVDVIPEMLVIGIIVQLVQIPGQMEDTTQCIVGRSHSTDNTSVCPLHMLE